MHLRWTSGHVLLAVCTAVYDGMLQNGAH